jgi:nitroreductase
MKPVLTQIETRRAWRALDTRPVPREILENLVRAAHLAPSCFNYQPWRFVVVTDPGQLGRIKETLPKTNAWIHAAPAIIGVCSNRELDCKLSDGRDYFLFDCGMAVANLMAQATEEGLVAHPVAGYEPEKVKPILGIPADWVLITLVNVGYRGADMNLLTDKQKEMETGPRVRKPLGEVLSWDRFIPSVTK